MIGLLLGAALAGYGDPVDGRPTHAEREVHLWTNAMRVDPEAYREAYVDDRGVPCWSDFTQPERAPKGPLAMNDGLYEAARFHSEDMQQAEEVSGGGRGSALSHDSSDGTSLPDRIARYYDGMYYGENVAWGYPTPYDVVIGWMCSPGHRANIQEAGFTELGTGQAKPYWTQDFGGGRAPRALNLGLHLPEQPDDRVTLYVDVALPASEVRAMVDGRPFPMKTWIGEDARGMRRLALEVKDAGCHVYWFEADVGADTVTWPEDGAYGWGPCVYDDEATGWIADRDEAMSEVDAPVAGGCTQAGGGAGLLGAALGLLALRRRRGPQP